MNELRLTVVTPDGAYGPYICDSVRLNAEDDPKGRRGGSCGIRPGHIDALFSLEKGELTACMNSEKILTVSCGDGIASVSKNVVTVITEEYKEI